MWIPKEIDRLSTRLKEGRRVHRITVRDLLRMFKAERRGLNKVHDIRTALDSLGLVTDPDFESVWIDGKIRIRLKDTSNLVTAAIPAGGEVVDEDEPDEEQASSSEEQEEADSPQIGSAEEPQPTILAASEGVVETVLSEPPDPTFRIGSLPAANKPLTTVGQDAH
jgi:hypothetical protein